MNNNYMSMKLIWECDGQLTPYTVYKSETIFDKNSLPEPYKTNLSKKEILEVVTVNDHFYYMIRNGDHFSEVFDYKTINYIFPVSLPIVNPDSLDGITGWTVSEGTLAVRSGYFYGISASVVFYQDVLIPEYLLSQVDSETTSIKLEYMYGGWYNDADRGQTQLIFLDSIGTELKSYYSADESLYNNDVLTPRSMESYLPKDTRYIRIKCVGTRVQGTNLDAYWSGFKLSIHKEEYQPHIKFDTFVSNLNPLTWLKLDEESSSQPPVDYGIANHTVSYNNLSGITFRQKPLRKGHSGSMGFSVGSNTNSKIQFLEGSDMLNITKGSHTWFIFLERTTPNNQERLFGDNGDGVNKRVCWSAYDFPNNQRQVNLRYLINQPQFICITYNVEEKAYRLFTNGKWYSQTYVAPPTSTSGGQWMTLPQTAGYTHYGIRGYVSDFTWFNRALTSLEVEKIYQLGKLI